MNNQKVLVEVRDVYGNRRIYPANETAKLFTDIAGTRTLDPHVVRLIRKLGYEIEVKLPELSTQLEVV